MLSSWILNLLIIVCQFPKNPSWRIFWVSLLVPATSEQCLRSSVNTRTHVGCSSFIHKSTSAIKSKLPQNERDVFRRIWFLVLSLSNFFQLVIKAASVQSYKASLRSNWDLENPRSKTCFPTTVDIEPCTTMLQWKQQKLYQVQFAGGSQAQVEVVDHQRCHTSHERFLWCGLSEPK